MQSVFEGESNFFSKLLVSFLQPHEVFYLAQCSKGLQYVLEWVTVDSCNLHWNAPASYVDWYANRPSVKKIEWCPRYTSVQTALTDAFAKCSFSQLEELDLCSTEKGQYWFNRDTQGVAIPLCLVDALKQSAQRENIRILRLGGGMVNNTLEIASSLLGDGKCKYLHTLEMKDCRVENEKDSECFKNTIRGISETIQSLNITFLGNNGAVKVMRETFQEIPCHHLHTLCVDGVCVKPLISDILCRPNGFPGLQVLSLHGTSFMLVLGNNDQRVTTNLFQSCPNVHTFKMPGQWFSLEGLRTFLSALKKYPRPIQYLDFSYSEIKDEGASLLAETIENGDCFRNSLKTLKVAYNNLELTGMTTLIEALGNCCKVLECLNVKGNSASYSFEDIEELFLCMARTLSKSQSFPCLEIFDVCCNYGYVPVTGIPGLRGFHEILSALYNSPTPRKLKVMNLFGVLFTLENLDLYVKYLCDKQASKYLAHLNVGNYYEMETGTWPSLGHYGTHLLAYGIKDARLLDLCLDGQCIGDSGVECLFNFSSLWGRTLLRLEMDHNNIGPKGIRAMVGHLQSLEVLSLSDNPLGDEGSQELVGVLVPLRRSIRKVTLRYCSISSLAVESLLTSALVMATRLKYLDLAGNKIGITLGYKFKELFEATPLNLRRLQVLVLSNSTYYQSENVITDLMFGVNKIRPGLCMSVSL